MALAGRFGSAEGAALAIAVGPELCAVVSRVCGLNAEPTAARVGSGMRMRASAAHTL